MRSEHGHDFVKQTSAENQRCANNWLFFFSLMVVKARKNHLGPEKSLENEESVNVFQDQCTASIPGIFNFFFQITTRSLEPCLFVCSLLFVCLEIFGLLINKVIFRSCVELQEGGSVGIPTSLHTPSMFSIHVTKLLMISCEPGRAERGSEFKFLHPKVVLTTE